MGGTGLMKVLEEPVQVIHLPDGLIHRLHDVGRVLLQFLTRRLLLLRLQLFEPLEKVEKLLVLFK